MLFVMVRGRHRGLPLAIDRSILLPGEELMQRLDLEYGGREDLPAEGLQELVTSIEESGAQTEGTKSASSQQDLEAR